MKKFYMHFNNGLAKMVLTCALFAALLIGSQVISNVAQAADDLWYVGDGAKPDTFVTYKIQEQDTNSGRPFEMTIYFKEYNSTGKYWVAPVFVVDQGRVINGTFHLSDLDLTALGSSQIPREMAPYRSAYTGSLKWLSAFVSKPGQSLTAPYWGKIASIGGSPISPGAKEQVTVPAGTFDTTLIKYHKGVDNKIWIKNDFPYPIKAETYADITTGNPPVQFAFELIATGQGMPKEPKSTENIPKPPLEQRTERGTYFIQLFWEPETIKAGNATRFGIVFKDDKGNSINQVGYNFAAIDSKGELASGKDAQITYKGTAIQQVTFKNPGPAKIRISISSAGTGADTGFVETGEFGVVVLP
jgi:hypothetical protein